MSLDLLADLNNEDDEGHKWGLLRNARDPAAVEVGVVLKAGRGSAWTWVRVLAVDDDGQVHFEQIDADEARQLRQQNSESGQQEALS